MKGYADYLVRSDAETDREIERNVLNVEVPYLAERYKEWMTHHDGKTQNVANAYTSYIKAVDKEFFLFEEDFFSLLPQKVEAGDLKGVSSLFDKYLNIINEWLASAKKEDVGYSPKVISDWRSGFKNYRHFIEEWLLPQLNDSKNYLSKMQETDRYRRLFAEDDFLLWLTTVDEKNPASAQSYISRLKRLDKVISEAISAKLQNAPKSIFGLIPKWLKEQKGEKVIKLLDGIAEKLAYQVHANDTHLMPVLALRNSRSALNKYRKFIDEEYIEELSDDDGQSVEEATELNSIEGDNRKKVYDYPMLENNFRFRLVTQTRMSNHREIFFPIDIIRRLFKSTEEVSVNGYMGENEYKWFNKWLDNCIAEIKVMTDKGTFILADLSEEDTLIIDSTANEVTITLQDGGTAKLLTPTVDAAASPQLMKVNRLNDIHIDHTPLISNLLSENVSVLPTLVKLTGIIRNVAEVNNLSFVVSNFSSIAKKVMASEKRVEEMQKMIPGLKDELEWIRRNSTLCLMEAKYNLRKK
jgi:hypothetical protein